MDPYMDLTGKGQKFLIVIAAKMRWWAWTSIGPVNVYSHLQGMLKSLDR